MKQPKQQSKSKRQKVIHGQEDENKTKKINKNKKNDIHNDDWLSALVQKVSSTSTTSSITQSSSSSSITNNNNHKVVIPQHEIVLSKEERIKRRNEKKRRRLEKQMIHNNKDSDNDCNAISTSGSKKEFLQLKQRQEQSIYQIEKTKQALHTLSNHLLSYSQKNQNHKSKSNNNHHHHDYKNHIQKIYTKETISGKATAKQQLTNTNIQPRKNDYGGMGLARPSLLISLRDDSFIPKFEEEFREHIPGFFGKQRTKAMKKQLDGNMLWRRMLKDKNEKSSSSSSEGNGQKKNKNKKSQPKHQQQNIKYDGKKLSDMTPDERVEAMIKLGMI